MSENSRKYIWLRRLLPFVVLAMGIIGTVALVKSKRSPERKPRISRGVLVEVQKAQPAKRTVMVVSNGVIQPRREISIAPEVSGKVTWVNPSLLVGGFLRKGEKLFSIDATDYQRNAERSRANLAQAQQRVTEANSVALIARREWDRVGKKLGASKPTPLMLKQPQLQSAQAGFAASKADLAQARANLNRTTIRAPFNCRVRRKTVDLGQYVRVGQNVATLYGTDVAEVLVSLPISELRWLNIPRQHGLGAAQGSLQNPAPAAEVRLKVGTEILVKKGVLARSVGEIDAIGRTSKVIVVIEDPYNLKTNTAGTATGATENGAQATMDFEIGAFVEVSIPGKQLNSVIPLAAHLVHSGETVWIADADDRLQVRKVDVIRRNQKEAFISAGLKAGDRVITTSLSGIVPGSKLRIHAPQKGPAAKKETLKTAQRPSPKKAEVSQ